MKAIYFDLQAGISGDMILASLFHHVNDREKSLNALKNICINEEYKIEPISQMRNAIATTHLNIKTNKTDKHRHLKDIHKIIDASDIDSRAKIDAKKVFTRLAEVEATVHNTTLDKIHFHEVGAVDSIVDIVGSAILLNLLTIEKIYFGNFYFGTGSEDIAHGLVSLPVPAVSRLSEGYRFNAININTEMVTPTGAAFITVLGEQVDSFTGRTISTAFASGDKIIEGTPGYLKSIYFEI